jgi:uncharacterized protein (TIGR02246 family)
MCAPIGKHTWSPREAADAGLEAFNARDLEALAALYRPDAVIVTPDAGELKGREQVAEYHRGFIQAFPDGTTEVVAKHDAGNITIDEWIFRGTNSGPLPAPSGEIVPPTGRRVSVRGVDVQTHGAGGVSAHHIYFDQIEFLTQLGLMPEF